MSGSICFPFSMTNFATKIEESKDKHVNLPKHIQIHAHIILNFHIMIHQVLPKNNNNWVFCTLQERKRKNKHKSDIFLHPTWV